VETLADWIFITNSIDFRNNSARNYINDNQTVLRINLTKIVVTSKTFALAGSKNLIAATAGNLRGLALFINKKIIEKNFNKLLAIRCFSSS
jgi:hypothetical protein